VTGYGDFRFWIFREHRCDLADANARSGLERRAVKVEEHFIFHRDDHSPILGSARIGHRFQLFGLIVHVATGQSASKRTDGAANQRPFPRSPFFLADQCPDRRTGPRANRGPFLRSAQVVHRLTTGEQHCHDQATAHHPYCRCFHL
jgi:hypothetical protein